MDSRTKGDPMISIELTKHTNIKNWKIGAGETIVIFEKKTIWKTPTSHVRRQNRGTFLPKQTMECDRTAEGRRDRCIMIFKPFEH